MQEDIRAGEADVRACECRIGLDDLAEQAYGPLEVCRGALIQIVLGLLVGLEDPQAGAVRGAEPKLEVLRDIQSDLLVHALCLGGGAAVLLPPHVVSRPDVRHLDGHAQVVGLFPHLGREHGVHAHLPPDLHGTQPASDVCLHRLEGLDRQSRHLGEAEDHALSEKIAQVAGLLPRVGARDDRHGVDRTVSEDPREQDLSAQQRGTQDEDGGHQHRSQRATGSAPGTGWPIPPSGVRASRGSEQVAAEASQGGQEVRGGLVPDRAVLLQGPPDDPLESDRNGRVHGTGARRGIRGHELGDDGGRRAAEGCDSGRHLVEHDAEREQVRAGVHILAPGLLGRHEGHRPDGAADPGEIRIGGALGPRSGRGELGDPEVEDLGVAARIQKDVGALDVPVNHARPVRGIEGVGGLDRHVKEKLHLDRAFLDEGFQGLALQELHHDIRTALVGPRVVDGADVLVVQP